MNLSKRIVIAAAAAVIAAGALPGRPSPLEAQVLRCYDVVCTEDVNGVLRCVEKPTACPPRVT
jgi:hypothetical protein